MAAVPWLALAVRPDSAIRTARRNRRASFGSNAGLGAGNPLFQSSSRISARSEFSMTWFSDKDQGPAIQQFLAGIKTVDNAIASIIDEPTLAAREGESRDGDDDVFGRHGARGDDLRFDYEATDITRSSRPSTPN
jgi:hypothetical protein